MKGNAGDRHHKQQLDKDGGLKKKSTLIIEVLSDKVKWLCLR